MPKIKDLEKEVDQIYTIKALGRALAYHNSRTMSIRVRRSNRLLKRMKSLSNKIKTKG